MYRELCTKTNADIFRGKRNKSPNEVKPVENTNKKTQSLIKISPLQKKVPLHINCKTVHRNIKILANYTKVTSHREIARISWSFQSLSHVEQEHQKSFNPRKRLIQEKIILLGVYLSHQMFLLYVQFHDHKPIHSCRKSNTPLDLL